MKCLLFLTIFFTPIAHAGYYYDLPNSTTNVTTMSVSGSVLISASTTTYNIPTIILYGPSGSISANAFKSGNNSKTLIGEISPDIYSTGSGTEASPFVSGDGTGGVQTSINLLTRGGVLNLGAARYNISSTDGIKISSPSITINGNSNGFNSNPNTLYPGVTGTKLMQTGQTGIQLGDTSKPGGIRLNNLYLWGPSTNYLDLSRGIFIQNQIDQPHLIDVEVSHDGYAFYSDSVLDAALISDCSFLNNGYGLYFSTAAQIGHSKFSNLEVADNHNTGFYLSDNNMTYANYARISDSNFVRNVRSVTTNGANLYVGQKGNLISDNFISDAGHDSVDTGLYRTADGVIITSSYNMVTGNLIVGNTTGSGVHLTGAYNSVVGNKMFENQTDITLDASSSYNTVFQPDSTSIVDNGTGNLIIQRGAGNGLSINNNVGIGTTNPTAKLQIAGGANTFSFNPNQSAYQEIPAGFLISASTHITISPPGTVGAKMEFLYKNDSGYWSAFEYTQPSSSDRANISILKSGGNIGIGNTNPSNKLDISSGTITISGIGAPAISYSLCLSSGGVMGHCTSAPATNGSCNCITP